jgi:hypothetical protein
MEKIEIIIKPDGSISIDAIGFNGVGCEEATKPLEEVLGVVEGRMKKPEFFTRSSLQNKNKIQRGW